MYLLYQLLISIILLLSPIIVIFRILKNKEHQHRFIEKFSLSTKKKN